MLSLLDIIFSASCPVTLDCKNEGYIGPNCACICPSGLSGRDCSEVVQSNTSKSTL